MKIKAFHMKNMTKNPKIETTLIQDKKSKSKTSKTQIKTNKIN